MRDLTALQDVLDRAEVDPAVLALRPDYRALLLAVDGIGPGSSDDASEQLLQQAEASAREALGERQVEDLPHVAAWREAYRAFGAKPQRTRNSLEALLRRVGTGLPRVNRLTDVYNAVSVLHQVPLGGEDRRGAGRGGRRPRYPPEAARSRRAGRPAPGRSAVTGPPPAGTRAVPPWTPALPVLAVAPK